MNPWLTVPAAIEHDDYSPWIVGFVLVVVVATILLRRSLADRDRLVVCQLHADLTMLAASVRLSPALVW